MAQKQNRLNSRLGLKSVTTIAYKNGIIAYDSRESSSDDIIVDDGVEKRFEIDGGVQLFLCGSCADREDFIESYLKFKAVRQDIDIEALIFDPNNKSLFRSSVDDKGVIWKTKLRLDNHYAIGSGRRFALAFMDAGMSAHEAVIATAKRDVWTGGEIRTFEIGELVRG